MGGRWAIGFGEFIRQRATERPERRLGDIFGASLRRQGTHHLRSRCRSTAVPDGDAVERQRHHGRSGDADRGGIALLFPPIPLLILLVGRGFSGALASCPSPVFPHALLPLARSIRRSGIVQPSTT